MLCLFQFLQTSQPTISTANYSTRQLPHHKQIEIKTVKIAKIKALIQTYYKANQDSKEKQQKSLDILVRKRFLQKSQARFILIPFLIKNNFNCNNDKQPSAYFDNHQFTSVAATKELRFDTQILSLVLSAIFAFVFYFFCLDLQLLAIRYYQLVLKGWFQVINVLEVQFQLHRDQLHQVQDFRDKFLRKQGIELKFLGESQKSQYPFQIIIVDRSARAIFQQPQYLHFDKLFVDPSKCSGVSFENFSELISSINQKNEDILQLQNSKWQMCSIKSSSLLYSYSQAQFFTEFLEQPETELQAKIKLEEPSQQKYKIKLNNGFIGIYSLCAVEEGLLSCLPLDFNLKMSRIYKENENFLKPENYLQGIRLENSKGQSVSFYFNSSNQTYLWIKKLSFFVNQLHFQRLFKPVRRLGKGASAAVYEVRRLDDGKKFAAKVFCKERVSKTSQLLQLFKKEGEILRVLSCQDVIKFEGIFENENSYFLVMELAKGMNIYDFLLIQKTKLQKQQIQLIMRNIIKNLQSLQQLDIIHRDIKLENIIIDSVSLKTKVIDYGLAVYAQEQNYIHYSCGTPGYLSPQTVNNNKNNITTKSDIFSAGVVFHVLLTGVYLFSAQNAKQMLQNNIKMQFDLSVLKQKEIDPSAIDLLQKMLALSPEDRLSASQCLMHQFLREEVSEDDQKVNTPSTQGDNEIYQF